MSVETKLWHVVYMRAEACGSCSVFKGHSSCDVITNTSTQIWFHFHFSFLFTEVKKTQTQRGGTGARHQTGLVTSVQLDVSWFALLSSLMVRVLDRTGPRAWPHPTPLGWTEALSAHSLHITAEKIDTVRYTHTSHPPHTHTHFCGTVDWTCGTSPEE